MSVKETVINVFDIINLIFQFHSKTKYKGIAPPYRGDNSPKKIFSFICNQEHKIYKNNDKDTKKIHIIETCFDIIDWYENLSIHI